MLTPKTDPNYAPLHWRSRGLLFGLAPFCFSRAIAYYPEYAPSPLPGGLSAITNDSIGALRAYSIGWLIAGICLVVVAYRRPVDPMWHKMLLSPVVFMLMLNAVGYSSSYLLSHIPQYSEVGITANVDWLNALANAGLLYWFWAWEHIELPYKPRTHMFRDDE